MSDLRGIKRHVLWIAVLMFTAVLSLSSPQVFKGWIYILGIFAGAATLIRGIIITIEVSHERQMMNGDKT